MNYEVFTKKDIGNGKHIRLVLISDLHSRYHGKSQSRLMQRIAECGPDMVILAGDIFDDRASVEGAKAFLQGIKDLKLPAFYAPGNHEYRSMRFDLMISILKAYGIRVLEDAYCGVDMDGIRLRIAGAADTAKTKYYDAKYVQAEAARAAFGQLEDASFNLLILHRPRSIALYGQYPFDLVLSGHIHGGQLRIPYLIDGLFTPSEGFFPKYPGGLYTHGKLTHIVGRGISNNPPFIPRVFNHTELVIVDVRNRA